MNKKNKNLSKYFSAFLAIVIFASWLNICVSADAPCQCGISDVCHYCYYEDEDDYFWYHCQVHTELDREIKEGDDMCCYYYYTFVQQICIPCGIVIIQYPLPDEDPDWIGVPHDFTYDDNGDGTGTLTCDCGYSRITSNK